MGWGENANCGAERGLLFLSYSYMWKMATGQDDKRCSGRRLKGNDLDTPVGVIKLWMQPECICKKKRKGHDLLKGRLRLESAQTVAAAAVKHAFFSHSKINPDSLVLSPSTLSPKVGGKEPKP